MQIITEGSAKINIPIDKKISKKLTIFYNPVMKLNRDVSILLLKCLNKKDLQIALPLAGTGVRGIRFIKELPKTKIKKVYFNDFKSDFIQQNLDLNNIAKNLCEVSQKDANTFLLESKGFDYIDIDPFGTPNPFLDIAIKRISREGVLAVTATDTSALSGSSPKACLRKYWARPLRNEFMHETGIRILIRKVQLLGAQNDKALIPVFSYSKDHYYRVFFKCKKGKQKVDAILTKHKYLVYNPKTTERKIMNLIFNKQNWDYAGPLWIGKLWDQKLAKQMHNKADKTNRKLFDLISLILEESKIDAVGFYDMHRLAKLHNQAIPKMDNLLKKDITRTHFLGWGVRTKKPIENLLA